jgi:Fe-S-cluster containining protein
MTDADRARIEAADRRLLEDIASAAAEAVRKGGVACRRGCTECCRGPFEITMLDALRLETGLRELSHSDAARAQRVKARAEEAAACHAGMEDRMCPALDPQTGECDLYEARPVTCRLFGPATRTVEDGVAACELCYQGRDDGEVADRAVEVDAEGRESALLEELERLGWSRTTTVTEAIRGLNKKELPPSGGAGGTFERDFD